MPKSHSDWRFLLLPHRSTNPRRGFRPRRPWNIPTSGSLAWEFAPWPRVSAHSMQIISFFFLVVCCRLKLFFVVVGISIFTLKEVQLQRDPGYRNSSYPESGEWLGVMSGAALPYQVPRSAVVSSSVWNVIHSEVSLKNVALSHCGHSGDHKGLISSSTLHRLSEN